MTGQTKQADMTKKNQITLTKRTATVRNLNFQPEKAGEELDVLAFDEAILKKIAIEPMIGRQCMVRAQLRFDPSGELETIGEMRLKQRCVFFFVGQGQAPTDEAQGQLGV